MVRAWAATDPDAAVEWFIALPKHDRPPLASALLAGCAMDPGKAIKAVDDIIASDPAPNVRAADYEGLLVTALAENGYYAEAAQYVTSRHHNSEHLLTLAFEKWGQVDPYAAMEALSSLPFGQRAARIALVEGWASRDPVELVAYAANLDPGDERSWTLSSGMSAWAGRDFDSAYRWIMTQAPDPDADQGLAWMVFTAGQQVPPEASVELVARIQDRELRTNVLIGIAEHWSQWRPTDVRALLDSASALSDADRAVMQTAIDAMKE